MFLSHCFYSKGSRATNNTLRCLHGGYRFQSRRTSQRESPEMDTVKNSIGPGLQRCLSSEGFVTIWGKAQNQADTHASSRPLDSLDPQLWLKTKCEGTAAVSRTVFSLLPGIMEQRSSLVRNIVPFPEMLSRGNSQGDGEGGRATMVNFTQSPRTTRPITSHTRKLSYNHQPTCSSVN